MKSRIARGPAIVITDRDLRHLQKMIAVVGAYAYGNLTEIDAIRHMLEQATVVPAHNVPSDLVTMNSHVRISDEDSGEEDLLTLVYPALAEPRCGRISVLSPAGTALLGSRVGDVVAWTCGDERKRARIQEIVPLDVAPLYGAA